MCLCFLTRSKLCFAICCIWNFRRKKEKRKRGKLKLVIVAPLKLATSVCVCETNGPKDMAVKLLFYEHRSESERAKQSLIYFYLRGNHLNTFQIVNEF